MTSHKKSEMLEVRLSHPDKQALRAKAKGEGRSVSDVVRGLVSDYLAEPEARSTPLMELTTMLKRKPKILAAAALSALALPLAHAPFASADEIALKLDGEYVVQEGEDRRVRTFENEYIFENAEAARYPLMGPDSGLVLTVTATERGEDILLDFEIRDGDRLVSKPFILTGFDEPAMIEIELDGGESFKMTALPSRK